MRPSREIFWQQTAMEFDKLAVALLQNQAASFKDGRQAYLNFQKTLLRAAETERERLHIRRLVAHHILSFAYSRARRWADYAEALLRVRRVGYLSLEHRMHAACETLEWAANYDRTRTPLGWSLVKDAERRLHSMRRGHPVRKQALSAIASVKRRVIQKGLTPPATPPVTSTETSRRRGAR
jgi:hypothetical protein